MAGGRLTFSSGESGCRDDMEILPAVTFACLEGEGGWEREGRKILFMKGEAELPTNLTSTHLPSPAYSC